MITEDEIKVVDLLGEAWNKFLTLPPVHPDDVPEFRQHLHALQNIVLSREGLRQYQENYETKE